MTAVQDVQIVQVVIDVIVLAVLALILVQLHVQVANLVQIVTAAMVVEFVMYV